MILLPVRSARAALAALLPAALAGCGAVEATSAERFTASGQLIALSGGDSGAANACFTCHGLDGLGDGAGAPRLAGLDQGYLTRQLEAYAAGLRKHARMEYIAARLSPAGRQSVSAYYAGMPFGPAAMPASLPHPLYAEGDPARGLPACSACHGARGEGRGPANPALGGQPAGYLAQQLIAWRRSDRRSDPLNTMLLISRRLAPQEIQAVSAYAASLPGGPPRRESPAAFPAIRRDGPRNDASGQRPHEAAP